MAQIKHSPTQVTNGSQTAKLLGVDYASQIPANSIFIVQPDYVPYVVSNAAFDGTDTVLTLTGVYQGTTNAAAAGVVSKDMTAAGIPTISARDVGTGTIFTLAMNRIQDLIDKIAPGGLDSAYGSAEAAALKAQQWADNDRGVEVEPGKFSAKHWAEVAGDRSMNALKYRGTWAPSSGNYPTPLVAGQAGDVFEATDAYTVSGVEFVAGDLAWYNGTKWDRLGGSKAAPTTGGDTGGGTGGITGAQQVPPTHPYAITAEIPPFTGTLTLALPKLVAQFGATQVTAAARNYVASPNKITDIWLKPDGTYVYELSDLTAYNTLPRHEDYLHVYRVQTNATKITGVFPRRPTHPVRAEVAPRLFDDSLFKILQVPLAGSWVAWTDNSPVTKGTLYRTSSGDLWECYKSGTCGVAPTSPTYTEDTNSGLGEEANGTATIVFRGRDVYAGVLRTSWKAGVQWYFASLAAGLLAKQFPSIAKEYVKAAAFHLVNDWISGVAYTAGRKVGGAATKGRVWEAQTDGTTTGTNPFPSNATVGATCTDGTITWKCIGNFSWSSQRYFWYDTDPTMRAAKSPDSHDSYSACWVWAIWRYLAATGDNVWLNDPSPHYNLTYQQLIREVIYYNLSTQIASDNLTKTFQGDGVPFGGTYAAHFLMDNCEAWAGFDAAQKIFSTYVVDNAYATTLTSFRDQIKGGLEALWEEGTSAYKYVAGLTSMAPTVPGQALFYPLCMSQAWPSLWGVPLFPDRIRRAFGYMSTHYPDWWARNDIDDQLALGAHYGLVALTNNFSTKADILARVERERLQDGMPDLYVHDMAYYMALRSNARIDPLSNAP